MSPLPSMNLRIFPNISPAPYPLSGWNLSPVSLPFCLPGSIIPVPDHSFLHVLLLNPKKLKLFLSPHPPLWCPPIFSSPRLVHRKHSDVRVVSLRQTKEPLLYLGMCAPTDKVQLQVFGGYGVFGCKTGKDAAPVTHIVISPGFTLLGRTVEAGAAETQVSHTGSITDTDVSPQVQIWMLERCRAPGTCTGMKLSHTYVVITTGLNAVIYNNALHNINVGM